MPVRFQALPTRDAEAYWNGQPDANGQVPERQTSDGGSNPCRHCLRQIPAGESMLVLAYRPFPNPQPYSEIGPIFLCSSPCDRHEECTETPKMFLEWESLLMRGYKANDRIKYGTGQIMTTADLENACEGLFKDPDVAYIHLRSASNNCYQCRVDRVG